MLTSSSANCQKASIENQRRIEIQFSKGLQCLKTDFIQQCSTTKCSFFKIILYTCKFNTKDREVNQALTVRCWKLKKKKSCRLHNTLDTFFLLSFQQWNQNIFFFVNNQSDLLPNWMEKELQPNWIRLITKLKM